MKYQKLSSIRAIFPKKQESIEILSEKVFAFLTNLIKIDEELFSNWYEQGWSKANAKKNKVFLDLEWLAKMINHHWDAKFPQLGASFTFWSGKEDDTQNTKVSFRIGVTSEKPNINNFIGISLPSDDKLQFENDDNKVVLIKDLLLRIFHASEIEAD